MPIILAPLGQASFKAQASDVLFLEEEGATVMAEPHIWLAAAQDGTLLCPFTPPVEESIFTQTASTRG